MTVNVDLPSLNMDKVERCVMPGGDDLLRQSRGPRSFVNFREVVIFG
jgi:hypothetical protein